MAGGLIHVIRPAAGEPAGSALILMHGRATSEHDLVPLLDELDPEARLVGACPRGPLRLPPGGFHWYVVPRVGYPDPETFVASVELLSAWLEDLARETGVRIERTVLGGFSQGTAMAWALALGPGRPRPAGLLHISGFIPTVPGFDMQLHDLDGFPIAIAHGTYDPIIGVEFARDARARAEAAGADVLYRESPVPHTIDPRVLPDLTAWLRDRFPPPG